MSQFPPIEPTGMVQRPHRGVMILVLGILGIVVCAICGIVAWVMGNGDLKAMDAGQMDPEGRSLTKVGKILGIVGVCLWGIALVVQIGIFVLVFVAGVAGAARGGTP